MSKFRFLKTRRSRRRAAIGVVLAWLGLVYLLPRKPGNVVALVGGLITMHAYFRWASCDPTDFPKWGCYILMPGPRFELPPGRPERKDAD